MKRNWIIGLAAFLIMTVGLAGCGGSEAAPAAEIPAAADGGQGAAADRQTTDSDTTQRVIKHLAGETTIAGTPERVVVMEYGLLASVIALGVQPIGFTDDERISTLEELGFLERMGDYTPLGSRQQPNLEVIRTLKPDLIIGDFARHAEVYGQLSDIAPTLMLADTRATYEDALENHVLIGEALNRREEAEAAVQSHRALLEETVELLPADKSYLIVSMGDNVFNARTSQFFQPSMLAGAGLNYALVTDNEEETVLQGSIEQLLEIDPDVMFVTNAERLEQWRDDPLYQQLAAVQNEQVYPVLHSIWSFNRSIPGADGVLRELQQLAASIQ